MTTRRSLLATGATLTLLAPFARLATAAPNPDARLVLIILRGGLDGLAAVPPYAEPAYAQLRGSIALAKPGSDGGVLDLDGTFGLHPALTNLHAMYRAREALVLHATATPYRDRSHFDAQNVLEAGGVAPSGADGGWLNRALAALDDAGNARASAVALADSVPLVLRGELAVSSWAPSRLPVAGDDLLVRVRQLYWAADPALAQTLYDALEVRAIVGDTSEQRMDGRAGLSDSAACERSRALSREPRRPAHRRARRGRLGHACEPRRSARPARAATARARRRLGDAEVRAWRALARDDGAGRYGVWESGCRQRHARHGSRHGRLRVPRRRRRRRRPRARRLARARGARPARRPRPARDDGSARTVQSRAARALRLWAKPRSRARSSPPATPSSRSTG